MSALTGKKLLILGGTQQACDAVRVAKDHGIYVIVTDFLKDSPAKVLADESYQINITDVNEIVALCRRLHIDGIMTVALENMLPFYIEICGMVGLPCYISQEQLDIFTNKHVFKEICRKYGLPTIPEYRLQKNAEESILEFELPVIVKPADSFGSKGVSLCYNNEEIVRAIEKASLYSQSKQLLVEKYMTCDDVIINYTFADGKISLSAMGDRFVARQAGTGTITNALIYPSKYLSLYLDTFHSDICRMFQGVNIKNGVMFIQAFIEKDKFYCYDPGFRTCGAQIYKIVKEVGGVDQMEMLIRHALTGTMGGAYLLNADDPHFRGKHACNMAILLKDGVIGKIDGLGNITTHPNVINVTQLLKEGDEISLIGTLKQTLARMHIVCASKAELRKTINEVQKMLKVEDIDGDDMLLSFFDADKYI